MARKPEDQAPDFEQALSDLEALVSKMEAGDLSLEESLAAFEQGVKLTRECQSRLAAAEQRVQLLVEEGGKVSMSDFKEDEAE